jgi:hypothetical protein
LSFFGTKAEKLLFWTVLSLFFLSHLGVITISLTDALFGEYLMYSWLLGVAVGLGVFVLLFILGIWQFVFYKKHDRFVRSFVFLLLFVVIGFGTCLINLNIY